MAEVLPTQSYMGMEMGRTKSTSGPMPNPPFVFPLRHDATYEAGSHGRSSSNLATIGSRRPAGRSRPHQLSLNALPAFDFSPAGTSPVNLPSSPPRSPTRRTPPHHHPGGHRRNGSEFVGGDISNGGPVLISSSPTRNEHSKGHQTDVDEVTGGDVAACSSKSPGMNPGPVRSEGVLHSQPEIRPPTTKRGHTHRRSGAISSHDLSAILKPATEAKGGSAPTTPSDVVFQHAFPLQMDRSTSRPTTTSSTQEPLMLSTQHQLPSTNEQHRSRVVGFSDHLEYIPRPLSTVSSETSSSMSTVRASHSVTNSITSIVSGSTSSPPPANPARLRPGPSVEHDQVIPRPSTAESPALQTSGSWAWGPLDTENLVKRPLTAPAGDPQTQTSESLSVGTTHRQSPMTEAARRDPFSASNISTVESNRASAASEVEIAQQLRRLPNTSLVSPTRRPRTSPEPKVTKRQRKRKSWADLLSRKAKQQEQREGLIGRSTPTYPLRNPSPEAELSLDDIDFDNDTTFILESTSTDATRPLGIHNDQPAWNRRESNIVSGDNSTSMLDIDAALGSFDTASSGPAFEDVIGSGAPGAKRRMHSSGFTGGFAGPGMHYHRRAESAPELEAVDRSRFCFPRLGSNPAMAIEEEEEEVDDDDISSVGVHRNLGVKIVEAASTHEMPMQRRRRRSNAEVSQSPKLSQQHDLGDFGPVEIVDADEEPRFSVVTKSSDESTITPTLSHDALETRASSAPFDFAIPTPALTYGTPETPSAVSSPDFNNTSFDVPRLHTASSSITDRVTLNSNRTSDGLGLHSSVDDVPSLTSSASTMSAWQPRCSSSANTFSSADRSSSLSAAVPARTRPVSAGKRASLASLTRLVGSSYNRSKLNIEMSAPPDSDVPTEKKKGHRISRLMKFWKSKEKHTCS